MGFQREVRLFLYVLLSSCTALGGAAAGGSTEIRVRVFNRAGIGRTEMRQAEAEAARVFRAAGVEIQWLDCQRMDCHQVPRANEFLLNIVPDGRTSTDFVFGVAFLGPNGEGKYGDVFFRRIQAACAIDGRNLWRMLGTVIAHELGHLVLGSHAHSGAGIMMALWRDETLHHVEMGTLLFTKDQAVLMKARMGGNEQLFARSTGGNK